MTNDYEALVELHHLKSCWSWSEDVYRGQSIVRLRKHYSLRELAVELCCSEGLIRHLEIVGTLPSEWKRALLAGQYSTRKVVAVARARRRKAG